MKSGHSLDSSFFYDGLTRLGVNPSQVSAAGLVITLGSSVSLTSENSTMQVSGLLVFIVGRLLDILDGKYARYLMEQKRWSAKHDGATLDAHCDKGGIYAVLGVYCLMHSQQDAATIMMEMVAVLMLSLDIQSTFMRETQWKNIIKSLFGGRKVLEKNSEESSAPKNPAKKANGWGKAKTTFQTVGVGALFLHNDIPDGPLMALVGFTVATVFSILSLLQKKKMLGTGV